MQYQQNPELYLLAQPVLLLFSGGNFINALVPMRIITPIIFIISTASLLGSPLSAMRKEKLSLIAVCIGATTNLLCNMLLIPKHGAAGAAIGTVIAESSVMLFQVFFLRKYFMNKQIWKNAFQVLVAVIVMGFCVYFAEKLVQPVFIKILVGFFAGVVSYAAVLLAFRNFYFWDILKKMTEKVCRSC